jgi:DNA replication protein DnaC
MSETLPLQLKELRLPAFARHYQPLADEAVEQAWLPVQYLARLCDQELAERYRQRIERWTHEARLPPAKTFSTLESEIWARPVRTAVQRLREDLTWAHRGHNVLLIGPSGVGKTHLAAALGHRLIEQGMRSKFVSATALVQQLQKAKHELNLMGEMTRWDKYRVVILDDIGYVKKTDAETHVLLEFIAHRYESASLIITCNQPFSQWDQIFPDNIMTVAAVDRLVHHATILEIKGESYRKKQQTQEKQSK